MAEKRDLEFFMANPGEMPGSLDELEAVLTGSESGEGEGGEGSAGEQGESSAASGAPSGEKSEIESGAAAQVAAAKAGEEGQAEQAAVVLSKDGSHRIPYSVLQTEREQRKAAEQAARQLQEQVNALTARANGTGQAAAPAQAEQPELSAEDLAQIESDFPATGKVLKTLMAKVTSLTQELGSVRDSEGSRRQREANTASTTVQEAIDSNSTLSFWQGQQPEMFKAAVQFDNQIKADPRNRSLSLDERFAKVVKAVEAVYGETELPAEFKPAPAPAAPAAAAAPAAPAKQATETVAARAQKAVAEAEAAVRVGSLSDIPGGVAPHSDELSQLAELSAQDLGNKFMKMDPNQVLAILARAA